MINKILLLSLTPLLPYAHAHLYITSRLPFPAAPVRRSRRDLLQRRRGREDGIRRAAPPGGERLHRPRNQRVHLLGHGVRHRRGGRPQAASERLQQSLQLSEHRLYPIQLCCPAYETIYLS